MLQYILKLSISISVVYLFYQLFLRRLTFYNSNRWYLLIYSMLCLFIPFINVFTIVSTPQLQQSPIIRYIPAIEQMTTTYEAGEPAVAVDAGINYIQLVIAVIGAGMVFMLLRLLVQYYSLFKIRSKAVLLYSDNVKLYHIDKPIMPFSFGRSIYINQGQHNEDELKEIIRHEFIHVKQRHTVDIIWSELLCIINWYNPCAWLLRKAIRQNLEFIADEQVLQTGLDRKQYQYLLLKVIGVHSFSIATNFNFSSLKKRIAMMNKTRTAKVHLIRFLFMLPLLVVILLAFRNSTQHHFQTLRESVADTLPAVKAPKLPEDVVTININDDRATVVLKNGRVEKFNLLNAKEKEAFEKKYGPLPEPPLPPDVPEALSNEYAVPPLPPVPPVHVAPAAPAAPVPMDASCFNKKGYCITIADNNGECVIIVKNKNNKIIEAVTLVDWSKNKQYEAKYGEIPPPRIPKTAKPVVSVEFPKEQVTITAQEFVFNSESAVFVAKAEPAFTFAARSEPAVAFASTSEPALTFAAKSETAAATASKSESAISSVALTDFKAAPVNFRRTEEEMAVIDKHTSKEDLEQIRKTLKDKGFALQIKRADYREGGELIAVSIVVQDSNGKQCSFSTNKMLNMKLAICKSKNEDGSYGVFFQGK